jgi:G:T-mismatch repair DNA endonuclease (very short patch repair protein)
MTWSKESKERQSELLKQRYLEGKGPSQKGKLNHNRGIVRSEVYKKNMSEIKKKQGYLYIGKNNPFYGKKHSPEILEKIRLSSLGRIPWNKGKTGVYSQETKKRMAHHKLKGRTHEEIYGTEGAKKRKELMSKKMMGHPVNQKTRDAVRKNRAMQKFPFKDSSIELFVQNLLKQLGINFYAHHYISDIEHKYRCDIYIPNIKTVLECDGDYWHGNSDKYPSLNERQKKQKERDNLRTKELMDKGYRVIRIWENKIKQLSLYELKDILIKQ